MIVSFERMSCVIDDPTDMHGKVLRDVTVLHAGSEPQCRVKLEYADGTSRVTRLPSTAILKMLKDLDKDPGQFVQYEGVK